MVIGAVNSGYVFHLFSWASYKSLRTVPSTTAVETLASGDAADELVTLADVIRMIFDKNIIVILLVDSKYLYHALSTKVKETYKSEW